jgi:hypothetical protein
VQSQYPEAVHEQKQSCSQFVMLQPRPGLEQATGSLPSPNGQSLHAHHGWFPVVTQEHVFVRPDISGMLHDSSPGAHGEFIAHAAFGVSIEPSWMGAGVP